MDWEKTTASCPLRDSLTENTAYYDDAGNQVVFKAGKTYIQTRKDTKEVTISR